MIHDRKGKSVALGIPMIALLVVATACGSDLPECFVEFAGYDTAGQSVNTIRIVSVKPGTMYEVDWDGPEALGAEEHRALIEARGSRLYFTEDLLYGWPIGVTLESDSGAVAQQEVYLFACHQRRDSVFFDGQRHYRAEESTWFESRGRLTGCALDEQWWVRSSPLFGVAPESGPLLGSTHDGYIEAPASGEFSIRARHRVRHMIIVGKGADPVKVFTADLDAGSNASVDLGEFDLSDSCPVGSQ